MKSTGRNSAIFSPKGEGTVPIIHICLDSENTFWGRLVYQVDSVGCCEADSPVHRFIPQPPNLIGEVHRLGSPYKRLRTPKNEFLFFPPGLSNLERLISAGACAKQKLKRGTMEQREILGSVWG